MIFNSESEIYVLEYISHGSYGNIYRKENKAIKKYREKIKGYNNPCFRLNKKKFKLYKKRQNKIKYTTLPTELIYVNHYFVGVVYDYIDGDILTNIMKQIDFEQKKSICYDIIRNAKELTDHHIYPLDYKLNNIMYDQNNQIKIIDLDDIWTKATYLPNYYYYKRSLYELKETLLVFLDNKNLEYHGKLTYQDLEKFVKTLKK